MKNKNDLIKILEKLQSVLVLEKDALVNDKTDIIDEILEEKSKILDKLSSFDLNTIDIDEEIKKSFADLMEIQRTNQMLTEQALSYEKNIMESIAKVLSKGNTYKKSGIENNDISTFIDQTV